MNTPAHLLLGSAVMARGGDRRVIWAAMLGALLPDLSLYLLAGVSLQILNIAPQVVFDELYFSDLWQGIFAIDNSFLVWGVLFGWTLWLRIPAAIALTGAALLHLAFDFPLHHDDGRAHFWPLTRWVFESPVSYWDRDHGALWVAPAEAALALGAALFLWFKRPGWLLSLSILALLVAEMMVVRTWIWFFIDG